MLSTQYLMMGRFCLILSPSPVVEVFGCYQFNTLGEETSRLLHPTSVMCRVYFCDVSGVIVLTSSVCLLPLYQTYRLEFRHVGQVEGYLGQIRRSRSKVTRSKTFQWAFQWNVSRRSSMISPMELLTNQL